MPNLFGAFAGPEFGLNDVKIAPWVIGDTYSTAVDVPSVQVLDVQIQTVNGELTGDDAITDSHAIAISAQVKLRFGSLSLEALEVITGNDYNNSGTTPNQIYALTIDNLTFPYFGIAGTALSTQDGGDTTLWIPKAKVMEGFNVGMQYGQYVIPELTVKAVITTTYGLLKILKHETAAAITIPPSGAAV